MTLEATLANLADENGDIPDDKMLATLLGGGLIEGDTPGGEPGEGGAPGAADAGNGDGGEGGAGSGTPAPPAEPPAAPAPPAPAPAPAATPAAPAAAPAVEDPANTVILAKDGIHTIGYEKLVEAREEAKAATAEADRLRQELEAARRAPAPAPAPASTSPAPAPAAAPAEDQPLFGDYSEEAMRAGVQALIKQNLEQFTKQLEGQLTPLQEQQARAAYQEHLTTIYAAHPDADSIVQSTQFEQWKAAQPAPFRKAIEATQKEGDAQEMVELLDTYRKSHPRQDNPATAPAAAPAATPAAAPAPATAGAKGDPAARAHAAIEAAPSRPTASLSSIPAGGPPQSGEGNAFEDKSVIDMLGMFDGKSSDDIMKMLDKAL